MKYYEQKSNIWFSMSVLEFMTEDLFTKTLINNGIFIWLEVSNQNLWSYGKIFRWGQQA